MFAETLDFHHRIRKDPKEEEGFNKMYIPSRLLTNILSVIYYIIVSYDQALSIY